MISDAEISIQKLDHHTYTSLRKKRSFFDGAGTLVKFFFGNLDAEDGRIVEEKLGRLDEKEKETFNLVKQQVTVLKSAYDTASKKFFVAEQQQDDIQNELKRLKNMLDTSLRHLPSRVAVIEFAALITMELTRIKRKLDEILDIITSLNMGHLHPLILDAKELMDSYNVVIRNFKLKQESFNNFQLVTQIMNVQSWNADGTLYIRIHIPIPDVMVFSLKKNLYYAN